jgi:mono/diheme cytochrome c family protein
MRNALHDLSNGLAILRPWVPFTALALGCALGVAALIAPVQGNTLPEPASEPIDFARDIKPILKTNCRRCHATSHKKNVKGGFSIDTRASLLKGGDNGDAVKPGQSAKSRLIKLVTGPDPEMPVKGGQLTDREIALLRKWIDQDLPWPEGFSFADRQKVDIAPRDPELPDAPDAVSDNPIDRLLAGYFKKHNVNPTARVDDRTYIRRVSRDLLGLIPEPEQVERFVQSQAPDKRQRLVERLLNRNKAYATHWLTFWNDRLRNAYSGPGFIDGGRRQITQWLYQALYDNKPYDQFVRELIDPIKASRGFVKGIKWRGVVNASQRPELQVARTVSQVFLGTRLKCASCHDSFVDRWQIEDVYGLASVFSEKPLEIYRCDQPTGRTAEPSMIFPQLGEIDANAPMQERRAQLARMLTSPRNGRFARTIVNQLWAKMMGRGLISPVRNMANPPWHGDLLDWLASDLVKHNYNLKHTLKCILTSRAYQMPAAPPQEPDPSRFVFRGPLVKRMSAEQFIDAVSRVTGVWQKQTRRMTSGGNKGGQLSKIKAIWQQGLQQSTAPDAIEARWIGLDQPSSRADDAQGQKRGPIHFRTTVRLAAEHHHARAVLAAAGPATLYVNGRQIADYSRTKQPLGIDLSSRLEPGPNTIALALEPGQDAPRMIFYAVGLIDGEPVWRLQSDDTWRVARDVPSDWHQSSFDAAEWARATEYGALHEKPDPSVEPARFAKTLNEGLSASPAESLRAAIAFRDPLMESLGRPNRSQVVMQRDARATMLQALELTNGKTLDQMIKRGAERLLKQLEKEGAVEPQPLVTRLWQRALSREPNERELDVARDLLSTTPTRDKVADLIWAVTMLPEFQLIR